ncbi:MULTISPECIES: HD domain-containing protein [unclassified Fusibacter]|uniref:HD domain-containing protein n=1 Tax=unclassified Fusibacter TaxID=2624464 RepID=UPI0010111EE1|nr:MULTISPECIES: HD domain-containing protein [unclassified Fusibacter]MCK8060783.1 HD domain-containing protein [Fusibacter sp. A2]NPE23079.1 HD domain-containing protein [Fusibacter sp. A1]RXV59749.1 HD domain-containing protein [Fusibacter sp. A1]
MLELMRSLHKRTQSLEEQVFSMFDHFDREDLKDHTAAVVTAAKEIATRFDLNHDKLVTMAYFHDLGRLIPLDRMVIFCESRGYDVSSEEARVPGMLHQKASAAIARDVFDYRDKQSLEGIMIHTTLKAGASLYAKALFVADKLTWDETEHEFIREMRSAANESLEAAIRIYLDDVHKNRHEMAIYHPWTHQAYIDYC